MHEHIDRYKLINMNGRVYDPILGRFLSPDNFVQDAGSTQAYNRYTYCLNNPLVYSDPSGWISTETMPFQWIAPTYYFSSFFQPKFGAFAGDNYAVEYFSNFHNGGSHLAGAEVAGNFRGSDLSFIDQISFNQTNSEEADALDACSDETDPMDGANSNPDWYQRGDEIQYIPNETASIIDIDGKEWNNIGEEFQKYLGNGNYIVGFNDGVLKEIQDADYPVHRFNSERQLRTGLNILNTIITISAVDPAANSADALVLKYIKNGQMALRSGVAIFSTLISYREMKSELISKNRFVTDCIYNALPVVHPALSVVTMFYYFGFLEKPMVIVTPKINNRIDNLRIQPPLIKWKAYK